MTQISDNIVLLSPSFSQLLSVEFMVLPEGQGSTGLYQYFIKVVPTLFTDESKNKLLTNQYTFTERFRPLLLPDPKSGLLTAVRYYFLACSCFLSLWP